MWISVEHSSRSHSTMLSVEEIGPLKSVAIGAGFLFLYFFWGAVYRLYFSPIAKFPGPKLAALTFWYEFYFDVVKRGRYTWEIGKMHEKYGLSRLPSIVELNRS